MRFMYHDIEPVWDLRGCVRKKIVLASMSTARKKKKNETYVS